MPSEDRLRKGCSRAQQVIVYTYGSERNVDIWYKKIADKLERFDHLSVIHLPSDITQPLALMAATSMDLQCTINEGEIWFSDANNNLQFTPSYLKQARPKAP